MVKRIVTFHNILWTLLIIVFSFLAYRLLPLQVQTSQTPLSLVADISPSDHTKGTTHARVHIIEYADFECLHCKEFQPTITEIMRHFENQVQWAVRFYPLPQDANAEKEAEAAECINELGDSQLFWKFTDTIFQQTSAGGEGFPLKNLLPLAEKTGVNGMQFQTCLDSGKYYSRIQHTIKEADTAGIIELPSVIIIDKNGKRQLISSNQPYSIYEKILNESL